ncbi:hypothetical protein FRC07_010166 [Ceratobasidium sp. 392]|nr:hypothetical protein FRC07_010166 [Ceratobasidium sp. 392]
MFLQTEPIPSHLNKWRASTNQIQAQLIKRQADTAKQQVEMCGRFMESVSNMIEKLPEKEEWQRQEELAWETEEDAKDRFIRNWIESSAVVEVKGKGRA